MKFHSLSIMNIAMALLAILLVSPGTPAPVHSMEPPTSAEVDHFTRTGEYGKRKAFAEAIGNHRVRPDRLKKALQKARRAALSDQGVSVESIDRLAPLPLAPPPAWAGMPTSGNVKIFSLLIDFPEYPHVSTSEHMHDRLFGNGISFEAPLESLAAYYRRSSYGKLELNGGNTLGWYRPSYDRSAVPQSTAGRENLIKEALNHFQSQGHDFSQYDNDSDGVIDYFIVVWTGPDNGWGNFWWGYQPRFADGSYRIGGKRLNNYSWQWESRPMGQIFTPEVAIHETGHALGLPDYYDYDATVGPKGGVGRLDMMDGNSADHNCFSKWILEWITPTVISTGKRTVTLSPSAISGDAVLIMPGVTLGQMFSEFFMVQNRQRTANDSTIPDNGLLVWHVDAKLDYSGYDFIYNNSYTEHKLLRLMEADGLEEIEKGIMANAGDFYMPGDELGSGTRPSSNRYSGAVSGIHIYGIVQSGERFSAVLSIEGMGPGAPRNVIIR